MRTGKITTTKTGLTKVTISSKEEKDITALSILIDGYNKNGRNIPYEKYKSLQIDFINILDAINYLKQQS